MALTAGTWDIEFRPYGWMRLTEDRDGPTVYLQFQVSGPASMQGFPADTSAEDKAKWAMEAMEAASQRRFSLRSVVMQAGQDEALSGRTWRRIPMEKIEALLAQSNAGDMLSSPCSVPAPSLDGLREFFEATEHLAGWSLTTTSRMQAGDGSPGEPKRKFPKIEPPGGRITDDFLRDIADAYLWFSDAKKPPAPAIAEIASVPVRTVHRWIYEARKRELLPPARSGRAG